MARGHVALAESGSWVEKEFFENWFSWLKPRVHLALSSRLYLEMEGLAMGEDANPGVRRTAQ